MKVVRSGAAVLVLVCCGAVAQVDPLEVLARWTEGVRPNVLRMTRYACTETMERNYFRARLRRTPRNCDELAGEKKRDGYRLELESIDRFRLDVRSTSTGEMYSLPGANRFAEDLWTLIGEGPAASGPFGMTALQVAQGDAIDFKFLGEEESGGRRVFEFGFRVPVDRSHYSVRVGPREVPTSWDGRLLLDPENAELVRLTTRTSELPAEAFSCEIQTAAEYEQGALLARETRQRFVDRSGAEVESVVTFSGCGEAGEFVEVEPAPEPDALVLPEGLEVTVALSTRIDSSTAAGGDRFTGKVTRAVVDAQGREWLAAGTAVSGRLLRVAVHLVRPVEVALVLRVETVQVDGDETPIHVTGRERPKSEWLEMLSSLSIGVGGVPVRGGMGRNREAWEEGERNTLRFRGKLKVLEPGFLTEWVTVRP